MLQIYLHYFSYYIEWTLVARICAARIHPASNCLLVATPIMHIPSKIVSWTLMLPTTNLNSIIFYHFHPGLSWDSLLRQWNYLADGVECRQRYSLSTSYLPYCIDFIRISTASIFNFPISPCNKTPAKFYEIFVLRWIWDYALILAS